MPCNFYDHHRLVEIAERYDIDIDIHTDPGFAISSLLDDLKYEMNRLSASIGFVERYLAANHPHQADGIEDDDCRDDLLDAPASDHSEATNLISISPNPNQPAA